jgi:predicted nucleotide-binding protein (sugar kinase/HSP70/actin superfamily)
MVDAGYGSVPVISLAMDSSLGNNQPAFKIDWVKIMPIALRAILYSDCIAKFYYATLIRERVKGQADRLKDKYLEIAANLISLDRSKELYRYLAIAADDFNRAARDAEFPKVGIVGEIFLKFNPFAHKHLMQWLTEKGIEVVPPILIDFFSQSFVNTKVKNKSFVQKKSMPNFLLDFAYKLVKHQINKINAIGSKFKYFIPFGDIFEEAEHARSIITLDAQFGEGWLLPAEAVSYHNMGINHVLSLQPFGCIANHIISKGMEKKLKDVFPDMFMLPVDFDSGVSDVNITNRMLLFIDNLKKHNYATANQY